MKTEKTSARKRRFGGRGTAVMLIGLVWLGFSTQGSGGCDSGCSGCDVKPPTPPHDATFCAVTAVPCALFNINNGHCAAPACVDPSGQGCATDVFSVTTCDPQIANCPRVSATGTSGARVCFDHTTTTPQQACQGACNNFPGGKGFGLSFDMFPLSLVEYPLVAGGCQGNIDFSINHGYDTASTGTTNNYIINGCVDPGPPTPGVHLLTNSVRLNGAGSAQSTGNGIQPHTVNINAGHLDLSASNTSCNSQQTDCPVNVSEMEMDFDDITGDTGSIGGGGTHALRNGHMYLDNPFLTPSGTFFPAGGGLPASFTFPVPPGVVFDAIGVGDGFLIGTTSASDQELNATINLATGEVVYDFDLRETVGGNLAELVGAATTAQVVAVAPVLSATPPAPVNATSCSANVTLNATATSPLGTPVTIDYSVDTPATQLNAGSAATFALSPGTHTAVITARDSLGAATQVTEAVVVNDGTAPVFNTTPPSQTAQSCAAGTGTVHVTVPTAHSQCDTRPATVTGTVTQFNGAAVSIPITNGALSIGAGIGTIHWVATGANGATTSLDQSLIVEGPVTFYGQHGVAIADRSTVNGNVYAGGGGSVSVGNDSAINGNLLSASPVQLRDRTHVTLIDTNAGLVRGSNDVIGTVLTSAPTLPTFPTVSQQFTGTQAITVAVGTSRTLSPGQYGAVTVFSGGKLILSAGVYAFTSLDLEPSATLVTPSSSSETAQLFVRNSVIYRGRTATAGGALAPLFLGYAGTNPITIEAVYTGTIIAPSATLTLQSLNGAGVYTGEFFAAQVTLSPANTTNSNPFTCH